MPQQTKSLSEAELHIGDLYLLIGIEVIGDEFQGNK
jgi:hypothetical protein